MSEAFLKTIKSRRVIRSMTDQPIEQDLIEKILEAGRWTPAAGNKRTTRFVVIQDPLTLRILRVFSPGMFQEPQAVILLCIDWEVVEENQFASRDPAPYIDLGVVMQTMMLQAHAMGLGSGPVTSFSPEAIREILNLPENLTPEVEVCLGYATHKGKGQLPMVNKKPTTWQDLTFWGRFKAD
jgi:nitroreductase